MSIAPSLSYSLANSRYVGDGGLIAMTEQVHARLDTLTQQAASGLVADTYAGLQSGAPAALTFAPAASTLGSWQSNISGAGVSLAITQTTLTQISNIASNFFAQTNNLNTVYPSQIDSIAANARAALGQVASLLNSTSGNNYIFAGLDASNPPVPNAEAILTSGFYTQINAAVGGLAASGSASVIATTLGIAASNTPGTTPFATGITASSAVPLIQTGDKTYVAVGIAANANASAISQGSSTSGSYIRDILRGLATIGSLSSGVSGASGFGGLVQDTHQSLGDAITALNQDAGILGDRQTAMGQASATLQSLQTAYTRQVSDAQDVDTAQTLTALAQVQTQLQASYQLIAKTESLTLTKFL